MINITEVAQTRARDSAPLTDGTIILKKSIEKQCHKGHRVDRSSSDRDHNQEDGDPRKLKEWP